MNDAIVNLEISLRQYPTVFAGKKPDENIEAVGLAIHSARKHLLGKKHVTNEGYLMPGHVEGLPTEEAFVDFHLHSEAMAFACLDDIVYLPDTPFCTPKLGGMGYEVRVFRKDGMLYVPDVLDIYETQQLS